MKKFVIGVLACTMICGAVPYVNYLMPENNSITANAVDYTKGTFENLTYKAYSDHIEISGCDKSATEVTIPSEIDGLPVTTIGDSAFAYCTRLTSIIIPENVTSIESSAFSNCTGLTSIVIPDSITSIRNWAFDSCTNLKSITIPDSVTSIEMNAFSRCTGLTSITIKNPECEIYDNSTTISDTTTIYGYENSTAQAYAETYERNFVSLTEAPTGSSVALAGDANGDGTVDVADVVAISAYVGDSKNNPLDEQSILNGDVHNTGDGLTANDALMIQQYLSGTVSEL